jgi:fibronectin type 3 domain-containing protein
MIRSANTTSSSLRIEWDASVNATSYKLYRSTSSSGTFTVVYSGSATEYTNTGLSSGTTYYYKATAVNSAGESGYTSTVSGTTSSSGGGTTTKLAAPANLQANSGGSFVQVSWDPVSLATSYKVYRSTSANGTYSEITVSIGTSGSRVIATDSSPRTGTSYYKAQALPNTTYYPNLAASDLSAYVSVTR